MILQKIHCSHRISQVDIVQVVPLFQIQVSIKKDIFFKVYHFVTSQLPITFFKKFKNVEVDGYLKPTQVDSRLINCVERKNKIIK